MGLEIGLDLSWKFGSQAFRIKTNIERELKLAEFTDERGNQ